MVSHGFVQLTAIEAEIGIRFQAARYRVQDLENSFVPNLVENLQSMKGA